jgi:predicted transcriptional regulator
MQNLLVAALTHMVRFQTTDCPIARQRAMMMFDALSELKESDPEIQELCNEANALLII